MIVLLKTPPKYWKTTATIQKIYLRTLLFSIADYFYESKYKQQVKILSDTTQLNAF